MKFHHCWPTPGKRRLATTWKKSFRRPCSFLCRSGHLQVFCTRSAIYPSNASFRDTTSMLV